MALRVGHTTTHRHQGATLSCWLKALEMLMQWKHNCVYGVDPNTHADRAAHTQAVQDAYARNRGYDIGSCSKDYGLMQVNLNDATQAAWETALTRSPILLTGNYGMARPGRFMRIKCGHVVLAMGLSNSNKVVYLDPFRTGWNDSNYIYMTLGEAWSRLDKPFNVPDAYTTI